MRAQAANVGGEFKRKHGDGAVGKIDAGAAQTGFIIERRARSDVVSHVGDVDLEFVVAVVEMANRDGVVEVAGGFAVDGDDGEITKIATSTDLGGVDDGFDAPGLRSGLRRESDVGDGICG